MSETPKVVMSIPLPSSWRLGGHGDPIASFDGDIWLNLMSDGSVRWEKVEEATDE